ncbi:imidazole glycerol phosphate synthase HisHF [Cantharellus anzutake]|uniref:imidazole glycerol phosphate synthase HisHF n=1 Tax=Cantharellus anzutake TaxID=1750568 RepID=UPI001907E262|nr:imidazole glycerol phosphate synthase HisHF [Cantharellus anzutake]KAF8332337.1 imidazole glycerol phosphate synthase HisHF [Cantharellus anzutake]
MSPSDGGTRRLYLLDYGAGNVRSLANSLTELGYTFEWINSPEDFLKADKLIFPGVGAFETAIVNLAQKGLLEPLREYIKSGKPYFGICIGMQVLFASSTEPPAMGGLGIIDTPIAEFDNAGKPVPHMGWNHVTLLAGNAEDRKLETKETGMSEAKTYYFVHSYRAPYVATRNAEWAHTTCQYGREIFLATVRRRNIFACQFHPEKSGPAGLKVLKSWLDAPIHAIDAIYPERPKRLITIREMDGFTKRIIACMDVRANDNGDLVVTKGDQYDVREKEDEDSSNSTAIPSATAAPRVRQVRNLGKPVALARRYYEAEADEICLLNITSFRNSPLHDQPMLDVVRQAASHIFVPLTIGGGIKDSVDPDGTPRSAVDVAGAYFRAGADKVSIGSEAVLSVEKLLASPEQKGDGTSPIETIGRVYGRQAIVVSVDPRRVYVDPGYSGPYADEVILGSKALNAQPGEREKAWWYQCTIKGGREDRPLSVKQLVQGAETLGAGEILVNSIDRDGTNSGYDLDLVNLVRSSVRIPVVASSGAGSPRHFVDVFERTGVEAALAAGIFHRFEVEISQVKTVCQKRGVLVRRA